MTTSRFCEQCGTPLGDGVTFCESCGAAVSTDTPAAPVEPTAAAAPAGRASPRWVPLVILVVGILVIAASIVSAR